MTAPPPPASPWADAMLAAAVCAVDPALGGAAVRGGPGPARDQWLELLRSLLPAQAPVRRVPVHVHDDRLLGGLDLVATLRAGRPVAERGLLAEADGGLVILAGAERAGALLAARWLRPWTRARWSSSGKASRRGRPHVSSWRRSMKAAPRTSDPRPRCSSGWRCGWSSITSRCATCWSCPSSTSKP